MEESKINDSEQKGIESSSYQISKTTDAKEESTKEKNEEIKSPYPVLTK